LLLVYGYRVVVQVILAAALCVD